MSIITNIEKDIKSLEQRFGIWITVEFNSAEKLYNDLTDDEKKGALYAYGVIACINSNLDKTGNLIPVIQQFFPDLSLDVIHGFLDILIKDIGIIQTDTPLTLEEALTEVAKYLQSQKGSFWEGLSQTLGNLLAVQFSPTTPIQKFINSAELIYQGIIKPLFN